ncbi:DUF2069 domain-containing protein [Rubrivivax gelatinosus]|uniref:Putative membrane protein n=1 Tax=Rubrivivax gelatinosus TaxID=28068 RepID=A0A4R2MAR3_RUBGE|nr:DUF2069 domain-containing protein [Rubrivivax gelatinosus]MBK1686864.1 hypothetical protein [Rubrivivax gelatinosus]TCP01434.1 putative membrane protein [Rubrivivax gelatinosus]
MVSAVPAVPAVPDAAVRQTRALALASLIALIVQGLAWELWIAPTGSGTLALKVLPLVAAVPGMLRHRLYTFRWVSMALWLYVTEALVRSTSERGAGQAMAIVELVLCIVLFVFCSLYVRRRLRGVKAAA